MSTKSSPPSVAAAEIATAERDAALIKQARGALDFAKRGQREAERAVEAAREETSRVAGLLACAIADAVAHGADPVLVLPDEMPARVMTAAELDRRLRDGSGGFSVTGSRFPGWMEITVGRFLTYHMPTPRYFEWSQKHEARRAAAKRKG